METFKTGVLEKKPAASFAAVLIPLLLLAGSLNTPAAQGAKITEAQVVAALKSLDAALLKNDTKSALTNFAPDAAIAIILTESGETTTNNYTTKQYREILESGWSSFSDYTTERSKTQVSLAPDGQSATVKSTLLEKFRRGGITMSCLSEENYVFELVGDKILIKSMRNFAKMQ